MNCPVIHPIRTAVAAALWSATAIALSFAIDAQAGIGVYTVGGDASCGFTSIQAAVDAASPGTPYSSSQAAPPSQELPARPIRR